jgi:hypothetical protein
VVQRPGGAEREPVAEHGTKQALEMMRKRDEFWVLQ